MRTLLTVIVAATCVAILPVACPAAGEAPSQPEPKPDSSKEATPAIVAVPKSAFEVSTKYRDPFHPRSTRRVKVDPVSSSGPPPPDVKPTDYLVLKGLSQRLAIINGRTFAAGDEGEVTTERGKVKILCLEIRPNSVVVAVGTEGSKSELFLKD